jgi:hypothetical protein
MGYTFEQAQQAARRVDEVKGRGTVRAILGAFGVRAVGDLPARTLKQFTETCIEKVRQPGPSRARTYARHGAISWGDLNCSTFQHVSAGGFRRRKRREKQLRLYLLGAGHDNEGAYFRSFVPGIREPSEIEEDS